MLFSKEKDLILKICNGILLLWLIAALVFTSASIIEKIVPERNYSYEEYRLTYCRDKSNYIQENDCKDNYEMEKINVKNQDRYKDINFYTSLANFVIVSAILVIINKKKVK